MMGDDIKEFVPPPEAPVFEPTDEEFEDPLAFIEKIRPYVEKTGICKIRPPPDWQPPFSVNVDKFRFTPRVQKLNELEATTRVKFNFLDAIAKFWELQGTSLKIPMVDRKNLDIFKLYKTVHQEGGYEFVTRKRKWPIVARKMNCSEAKNAPTVLRNHYEKLLFPYDVFQSGLMTGGAETSAPQPKKPTTNVPRTYRNPNLNTQLKQVKDENFSLLDYESSPALKKLQFKAPGPKMAAVCESEMKQEGDDSDCCFMEGYNEPDLQAVSDFSAMKDDPIKLTRRRPIRKVTRRNLQGKFPTFQEDFLCHMCSRGDNEQYLLLCDGCDMSFHTFCLIPPITSIPKGEWRCPKCIAQEYDKPFEIYGFEQSKKEYNLQSFGEMADKFKSDYFKLPAESVPYGVVEKEFWRLVSSVDEEVSVEYGADLHTAVHGSGFPIKENVTNAEDEFYANSKWNLTNLASLPKSVLCHINANISGMKVPWLYVGMCFSSFCWHTEDHWSYSINYLHWGEPKTWYGIPADSAEQFENVVHEMAPELFEAHPDLLHHLVTIVNPNILMAKDVPVFRTDQEAGEFVVTFPRGYHAGFNQGYNLAEAVNFAPADWLTMGHRCVEHYRRMRRSIVFSHEELICKVAANPENLDLNMAKAIHEDMALMVEEETKLEEAAKSKGLQENVREAFELLPDDERQCASCATTCFLSGVTCKHADKLLSCIHCASEHCDECSMSDHILRYRYTLEELRAMLAQLKTRADSFDNWATEVRLSLDACGADNKISLNCLKELVTTAEQSQFPACEILEELRSAVAEAERCASVALQLVTKKHRTRHTDSLNSNMAAPSLNLEELQAFCRQLRRLPCIIDQAELVQDLMHRVESFQDEAQTLLNEPEPDFTALKQLFDAGIALDVDLPEIPKLRKELHQCRWLEKVRETLKNTEKLSLDLLKALLEESCTLPKKEVVERNAKKLRSLVTTCEEWELKAKLCLQARPRHLMSSVQAIVREALLIPVYLPNISALREAVIKAHDWSSKVDHVQNDENYPYLEVLEALVMRGRPIPVRLEQLPQMESQVAAALAWRDRTARTFLRKNSCSSLLEILTSRKEIGIYKMNSKPRKKKEKEKEKEKEIIDLSTLEEYIDRKPATQSVLFREAKQKELHEIRELRKRNLSRLQVDAQLVNQTEHRQFCVCRKGPDGYMLQCDLCKEWFHGTCVPLPRIPGGGGGGGGGKGAGKNITNSEASRTLKYLCPFCHRSRRPRLETILSLLVSLQKLPVRLAEGEALQFLTEYAMNWQDRVRQFFMKGNVSKICEKINEEEALKQEPNQETSVTPVVSTATLLQQNMALAISRQTQKMGDPLSTLSLSTPSNQNSGGSSNSGGGSNSMEIDVVGGQDSQRPTTDDMVENDNVTADDDDDDDNNDELRLSKNECDELEELVMEGDTLEVTLDECDTLWKILLSQRKQTAVNFHLLTTKKVDKVKIKRKRKKNEESVNEKENTSNGEKMKKKRGKKPTEDGHNKTGESILVKKRKYVRKKKHEDIVDIEGDEVDEDDDDEDEEEEPCSAQPCKRPSSDEVDWVQCDCCEQWYHNLCVGISAKKASELESYVCPYCLNPSERATATTPTTPSLDNHSTATSPTDSNVDVVSTTPCTTNPPSPSSPKTKTEQHPPVLVSVCSLSSTLQTNNDDTPATDTAVSCA